MMVWELKHIIMSRCIHVYFCRFKLLGILDDSEMIDVALRKLFFLFFFITMSDDGVAAEVDFHEYVNNCF